MLQRIAVRAARGRPMLGAPGRRCTAATTGHLANPSAAFQRRTFLRSRDGDVRRSTYDTLNVEKLARERHDYDRTRLIFLATGSLAGLIAMGYTAWQVKNLLEQNPKKLDGAGTPYSDLAPRKVVVHDKDGREIVPTGNSTVTEFPRTVDLPLKLVDGGPPPPSHDTVLIIPPPNDGDGPSTEYTLVGLGTRTVSFLRLEVYVVGFYIATADIAALQNHLIKRVNPIATALVSGEKSELRTSLLDPAESQSLWDTLLKEGIPARSLFRIVPVRDTDFPHLRDGFLRAIKSQSPRILEGEKEQQKKVGASADSALDFGGSVAEFRRIFNHGKANKSRELLIVRGSDGALSVVFDDGRSMGRRLLGSVGDERVSRALWMNYLGGPNVASESTRRSIVDGMIEFVERPIGTVATQVV